MSKESLWCSVLWWLLFLELQLPFSPLYLLHIPALLCVTLETDTASQKIHKLRHFKMRLFSAC